MFKKSALAAALVLGVTTAASANGQLIEWNGFATATETPVAAYSHNIDWNNLGGDSGAYRLAEWNGFGEKTATPRQVVSSLYSSQELSAQSTYSLPEFNGFGDRQEAPVVDVYNDIDWGNLYQS